MSGFERLQQAGKSFIDFQKANQPSLGAEARAFFRQGREDLLNTLMGGLAGQTREPGSPGTPTPQQVTEGLESRGVDLAQDTIKPQRAKQVEMDMDR